MFLKQWCRPGSWSLSPKSHGGCGGRFQAHRLERWKAKGATVTTWLSRDKPIRRPTPKYPWVLTDHWAYSYQKREISIRQPTSSLSLLKSTPLPRPCCRQPLRYPALRSLAVYSVGGSFCLGWILSPFSATSFHPIIAPHLGAPTQSKDTPYRHHSGHNPQR